LWVVDLSNNPQFGNYYVVDGLKLFDEFFVIWGGCLCFDLTSSTTPVNIPGEIDN
jgi:hypothetical protein